MKLVTILVDHYQRRGSPEFAHIITVRNHAQHFLVSLGPSDHTLVEVCRISLLIYADMIIFPLPASTRLRIRLVTMLVQALGLDDSDSFTRFSTAIAQFSAPERKDFVVRLGALGNRHRCCCHRAYRIATKPSHTRDQASACSIGFFRSRPIQNRLAAIYVGGTTCVVLRWRIFGGNFKPNHKEDG